MWKEVTGERKLNVKVKTDSKTLTRAIKSATGVSSKRLKIDIACIKEAIEMEEITEVEWISGSEQVADVLTKRGVSGDLMRKYVEGKKRD